MKKKNYKVSVPGKQKGKKGTILLEGDLSISNSKPIYEELTKHYLSFDNLTIKFRNVDNLDLSVVQLIESIRKEREDQKKEVYIDAQLEGEVKDLLQRAGFAEYVKK